VFGRSLSQLFFLAIAKSRVVTRRVPELALLVGLVLAGTFLAAVVALEPAFVTDPATLLVTVTLALAVLYPFSAFAVLRMEDPTWLLPPDPVLSVAAVAAAGVGLVGAAADPALAVAVAALLVLPPAVYNAGNGGGLDSLPAFQTLLASALVAVVVVGVSASFGGDTLLSGLVGVALVLLGGGYYTSRVPGRRAERRAGFVVTCALAVFVVEYVLLGG
jgi:hypothetical protein